MKIHKNIENPQNETKIREKMEIGKLRKLQVWQIKLQFH